MVEAAAATGVPAPNGREALRDTVYAHMLRLLTSGEMPPGSHLSERMLAERFSVSRGPIREAIRLLERDGWVRFEVGRGSFVRQLSPDEVEQVYEARMVVESASARLAAIRLPAAGCPDLYAIVEAAEQLLATDATAVDKLSALTLRFHHEVSRLSENSLLITFSEQMRTMSHLVVLPLVPQIAPRAWDEHRAIADAIRVGDSLRAEALMADHLEWSRRVRRQATERSSNGHD